MAGSASHPPILDDWAYGGVAVFGLMKSFSHGETWTQIKADPSDECDPISPSRSRKALEASSPILRAMFEALFVGASLFEAAVWFVGGLLLGGIGLAFFVDSLVFRRRAVKKRARILGVIGKKQGQRWARHLLAGLRAHGRRRRVDPDARVRFGKPRGKPAGRVSGRSRRSLTILTMCGASPRSE